MITATFPNTPGIHELDITCRRGETFAAALTFTGKDFTDCTLTCEVRNVVDRKRILQFTPILEGTNVIHLNKDASQMMVREGTYQYDLSIATEDDISQSDYVKGEFVITNDVTLNVANPLEDGDGEVILT